MKHILITGGAGYIGSHTCKALAAANYIPVTYDNLSRGHESSVKWGPLVLGDIHNTSLLLETIIRYQIDAVIHFAAFAYVGESVNQPELYYQNNVVGSISLFEAIRQSGVKNIVFSSTCSIYGNANSGPIMEESPIDPINPYARSKHIVEQILMDYSKRYDFNYGILRYFNAAGADADGDIGEAHDPEPHLFPLALKAALTQGQELVVYGHDYDTRDGSCMRDYVHVSDLADAHVMALKKIEKTNKSLLVNLGSETGFTVLEILKEIEKIVGKPVPYILGDRREGDPGTLVSLIEKAKKELSWEPKRSGIKNIISTALNWMKENQDV